MEAIFMVERWRGEKYLAFVCPGPAAFGMAAKANDVRSLGLALAEGATKLLAFLY
jgi:hypothetical protein